LRGNPVFSEGVVVGFASWAAALVKSGARASTDIERATPKAARAREFVMGEAPGVGNHVKRPRPVRAERIPAK
jgi:hypothetical protein